MKFFTTLACLSILLVQSTLVFSQTKAKELKIEFDEYLPNGNTKMTQKINEELFVVYNKNLKKKKSYIGYDHNLKEVFKIELEDSKFYPYITYNEKSNQLLIIEVTHQKGDFNITARTFDAKGKPVKQEKFLLPGKTTADLQKLAFAEDGSHFAILAAAGKKGQDRLITVYDIALIKKYTKEIKAKANETFEAYSVNTKGNVILASSTAENMLAFYKLDLQGQVTETLTAKKSVSGKEVYDSYLAKVDGDRLVLAVEKNFKEELKGFDVFDVNFASKKVITHQSKEFNEEYIGALYSKINVDHVLNRYNLLSSKFKQPKHLTTIVLQHLLLDKDNIYIVSEAHDATTGSQTIYYFAHDIVVSAFSSSGNSWNSIIGRRMHCGEPSLGGWASVETVVNQKEKKLQVLTSEISMGTPLDVSTYLRTVDVHSGEVSAPHRLLSDSYWSNAAYTTWLTPDLLFIFRTGNVMMSKKGEYHLNIIKVEDPNVQ